MEKLQGAPEASPALHPRLLSGRRPVTMALACAWLLQLPIGGFSCNATGIYWLHALLAFYVL